MNKINKKTTKKAHDMAQIMGINVLSTTKEELLTRVEEKITHNIKFSIMTPNPELVLMAQKNTELKKALNSADFPIPDGVGLKLAIPNLKIIKGRELFMSLINLANKNHWRIFLLGGLSDEAEISKLKIRNSLEIGNWKLEIKSDKGPTKDNKLSKNLLDKINSFNPHLLFVAFGNPKQEIFIYKNAKKLNAKCFMSVGGTFRYVAGLSSLPPDWLASLGLEWLWRLITEPHRIGRILNAVIVFPIKLFLHGRG